MHTEAFIMVNHNKNSAHKFTAKAKTGIWDGLPLMKMLRMLMTELLSKFTAGTAL